MAAAVQRLGRPMLGVAVFIAALAAWEAWARSKGSVLVPTTTSVLETAGEVWTTADFMSGVAASLTRLAVGLALAAGVGVALGLVLGSSLRTRRTLEPLVEFARAMPAIAIVPAAIVVLGLGDAMQIAVIAYALCLPVLVNTIDGVRSVSPEVRDTASLLQLGTVERALRVFLPCALPSIFAGLRVAVSLGLVVVVVAELVGEGEGLGRYIWTKHTEFAIPELYSGLLFLGVLGYALNRLFLVVERSALSWHYGSVGELAR